MKTINLFFDFKFTSLSPDAQPISLGIVSDDILNIPDSMDRMLFKTLFGVEAKDTHSKSFYAEFSDFDINRCNDWVKENVVRKLRFNNEAWGKNAFEEIHTEIGSYHGTGNILSVKKMLKKWLSQFSNYNIQFVCDCGTFDWYWMLQLLVEWDELEFEIVGREPIYDMLNKRNIFLWTKKSSKCTYIIKTGLPKLPDNISPVPFDLNDLIAIRKGITPREAFDIERLGTFCVDNDELYNNVPNTHNALFDARVIKETYNKLK